MKTLAITLALALLPAATRAAPPSYATGPTFAARPGYPIPYSRAAQRRYYSPAFEYPDRHAEVWRTPGTYYPNRLWR